MNELQLVALDVLAFGFKIGHLTGNEFLASRRNCNLAQQDCNIVSGRGFRARDDLECNGQQSVSSEHSNPFAKDFVTGGATAPEIIVVHAGKIIMDEGVGVDAFERAREGQCVIDTAMTRFGCCKAKNRSQTFAAREQTVTHRLVECDRFRVRLRQIAIQRAVDLSLPDLEILFQIHVTKRMLTA